MASTLNGTTPHLMVTDAPYAAEYGPAWRNRAGLSAAGRTGKMLNDNRADWREAWALFPGDVAYAWHGARHGQIPTRATAGGGQQDAAAVHGTQKPVE